MHSHERTVRDTGVAARAWVHAVQDLLADWRGALGIRIRVDDGAHVMKRIEERRETFVGDVHLNEKHNNEDEIDTGK